jgi:alpha-glucuronidase
VDASWLRYAPLESSTKPLYARLPAAVFASTSPVMDAARQELVRGVRGMDPHRGHGGRPHRLCRDRRKNKTGHEWTRINTNQNKEALFVCIRVHPWPSLSFD